MNVTVRQLIVELEKVTEHYKDREIFFGEWDASGVLLAEVKFITEVDSGEELNNQFVVLTEKGRISNV